MPTKITRADGKNDTLGCAVCHETVTVSEEQFLRCLEKGKNVAFLFICQTCEKHETSSLPLLQPYKVNMCWIQARKVAAL